jgi:hypothetical protein
MNIACLKTISMGFRETRKGNANKNRQTGKERSPFLEQPHCTEERDRLLDLINPKRTHPIAYHLLKIKWAVFGTLTWADDSFRKDTPLSEKLRFKEFYLLIKRACQLLHLKKDDILFYVTNERGRDCDCHLHFLIATNGLRGISNKKLSLTLNYLWHKNLQLPKSVF